MLKRESNSLHSALQNRRLMSWLIDHACVLLIFFSVQEVYRQTVMSYIDVLPFAVRGKLMHQLFFSLRVLTIPTLVLIHASLFGPFRIWAGKTPGQFCMGLKLYSQKAYLQKKNIPLTMEESLLWALGQFLTVAVLTKPLLMPLLVLPLIRIDQRGAVDFFAQTVTVMDEPLKAIPTVRSQPLLLPPPAMTDEYVKAA